jgi:hypothetical protein
MTKCKHEKIVTWWFEDGYEPAGLWSCAHCNLKFAPMAETFAAGMERAAEIVDEKEELVFIGDIPMTVKAPNAKHFSDAIRAGKDNQ